MILTVDRRLRRRDSGQGSGARCSLIATTIVVTCAHCFNTLKNEYPQRGGSYEVVQHTQLLNRPVREGRLTPVAPPSENGADAGTAVTYHDPCYIGRHNGVYDPPRELIGALPGVTPTKMPRHGNLSSAAAAAAPEKS